MPRMYIVELNVSNTTHNAYHMQRIPHNGLYDFLAVGQFAVRKKSSPNLTKPKLTFFLRQTVLRARIQRIPHATHPTHNSRLHKTCSKSNQEVGRVEEELKKRPSQIRS